MNDAYDDFCAFIDQSRRWSNPPQDILAPAFFIDDFELLPFGELDDPVALPMPFETFWLVFDVPKGIALAGNSTSRRVAIVVNDCSEEAFEFFVWGHAPSGRWGPLQLWHPGTSDAFEAMIASAIWQISQSDREAVETDSLCRLNAGRAKSKRNIGQVPPFIRISKRLYRQTGVGGVGSPKGPHERRGHLRRLKSGRQVVVRASSIHGGSPVPRHYRA